MLFQSFQITGLGVLQIIILGAIGYFLVKRDILGEGCLDTLSRLVIEVTLPVMIFVQLVKDFKFTDYPNWWFFPLLSIGITAIGLIVGWVFSVYIKDARKRIQFLVLTAFQNSGYLPLPLITALLPLDKQGPMLIYLFLFLLGFNLVMFSFGIYMLTSDGKKKFEWISLFSPPVVATLVSLLFVFLGLNSITPNFILNPLKMVGDCTPALALFVVGGKLAQIKLQDIDTKNIIMLSLAKLVILPLIGLLLVIKIGFPELIGLLIVMQFAMPPATLLAALNTGNKKDDLLISQGIFFSHLVSIITIPLFLSLYFMFGVIK